MLGEGGKNAEFALAIAWKGKRRRAERASKDLSREANAERVCELQQCKWQREAGKNSRLYLRDSI